MLLRQKQWQENESNPYTSRNTGGHAREADRERRCPTSPANGMQTSLCNIDYPVLQYCSQARSLNMHLEAVRDTQFGSNDLVT